MSSAAATRQAKYRRLLPRLVLGRAVYTRGIVTVHCAEPFDEPCDVTFRLVDAVGRTHAERSVTMDADSLPVGLGGTVNLPPGRYGVLATPPLQQFWGAVPVEHRMDLTVASPLSTDDAGEAASRMATVRGALSVRDPVASWLDLLGAVAPDRGDAVVDLVRRSLVEAERPHADALADALAEAWPGSGTVGGIDVTGQDLPARMVALAALAATQDGDLADWAAAQLDAHAFALALASVDGLPLALPAAEVAAAEPHAPLAWLLWGHGVADILAPAVQALALAGYVPPPVLGLVARAAGVQDIRLAPRGRAGLSLRRESGLAVASSDSAWLAVLAPDVRIAGTGAVRTRRDGTLLEAHHAAPAVIALPFWALQDLCLEADLVTGRCGEHVFALASTAALRRDPAAPEAGLLVDGPARLVCRVGAARDDLAAAARDRLRRPWPASVDAGPPADAIQSPYCCAAADAQDLTIRVGDAVLSLDLSAPRAAADGAVP